MQWRNLSRCWNGQTSNMTKVYSPDSPTLFLVLSLYRFYSLKCSMSLQGPHVGGGYGPYVQSQRLSIYQDHIQRLLKSGNAYRCFCSSERLDQVRERAKRTGNIIGYDGKCRHLSMDQIQQSLDNGDTFTIRLKVPSTTPLPPSLYHPTLLNII